MDIRCAPGRIRSSRCLSNLVLYFRHVFAHRYWIFLLCVCVFSYSCCKLPVYFMLTVEWLPSWFPGAWYQDFLKGMPMCTIHISVDLTLRQSRHRSFGRSKSTPYLSYRKK